MATRYSGTLRLIITYVDASESYRVRIFEAYDNARFETLTGLRLPPAYRGAVDSADAYDRVARAALSFAAHDDDDINQFAATTDESGEYTIHRTAREAVGSARKREIRRGAS